jgi:uncharacterized protein
MIEPKSPLTLVCPVDRTPLSPAGDDLLAQLNRAIAAGRVKNRAGRVIDAALDDGLVRADDAMLYPVLDGIPMLLADEGIPLTQIREGE